MEISIGVFFNGICNSDHRQYGIAINNWMIRFKPDQFSIKLSKVQLKKLRKMIDKELGHEQDIME